MFLLSTKLANAESAAVVRMNTQKTRVILNNTEGRFGAGDSVQLQSEFLDGCVAKVVAADNSKAVVDVSKCADGEAIKIGAVFTKVTEAKGPPVSDGEPTGDVADEASLRERRPERQQQGPTINEDWYTLWGLGFSWIDYGSADLNTAMKDADKLAGVTRTRSNSDLLGFYWPASGHRALHGFILRSRSDTLNSQGQSISVSQSQFSYSFQRFFGANIGDGVFVRGDIGPSRYSVTYSGDITSIGVSDWGLGLLAGGGYSWAIGEETRMLLGGYVALVTVDDSDATSLDVTMGFLF
jgi:hypothetical protein